MNYLLSTLMGALIGYITNWLAIKMLFRPYERKYLFNKIPIPFTPGLIPKEKPRIAKSVGDTVGDYLLSEEVILRNLQEADLNRKIDDYLVEKTSLLEKSEKNLGEILEELSSENLDYTNGRLSNYINNTLVLALEEETNRDKIINFTQEKLMNLDLDSLIDKIDLNKLLTENKGRIGEGLEEFFKENKVKLEKDERRLVEVIGEDLASELLRDNMNTILIELKNILNNKEIEYRVKVLIREGLELNLPAATRLFLNPETLTEKVYDKLKDYSQSPDCSVKLIPIIEGLYGRALDYKLKDIFYLISYRLDDRALEGLAEKSLEKLKASSAIESLEESLKLYLKENKKNYKDYLGDLLEKSYDLILIELRGGFLFPYIDKFLRKLEDKKIKNLMEGLGEDSLAKLRKKLVEKISDSISKELPKLIKELNISKIVEEEINSFDLAFAEKIILDIARKELEAITWFGAFLGGLIGLLAPIIF